MKSIIQLSLLSVVFCSIFTSCRSGATKENTSSNEQIFTIARIDSSTKQVKQTLVYPVFTGENADKLNAVVVGMYNSGETKDATAKTIRQAFKNENIFMIFAEDMKGGNMDKEMLENMEYSQDDSIFVCRTTPKLISLASQNYIFTGGAHGSSSITYKNINPATGTIYTLGDFFKPNATAELTKLGEKYFKEQFLPQIEMKPTTPLTEENGFWFDSTPDTEAKDNLFYLSKNFAITDKGIAFCYEQYEVAPYAFGMPMFYVPFADIKSMLKDEWAAEFIAK